MCNQFVGMSVEKGRLRVLPCVLMFLKMAMRGREEKGEMACQFVEYRVGLNIWTA